MLAQSPPRYLRTLPVFATGALLSIALLLKARQTCAQAPAATVGNAALQQFEPTPAGDSFFSIASPEVNGHLVPRASVIFDHALNPLKLVSPTDVAVVSSQGFLHVDASLALWNRLLFSIDVPAAIVNTGRDPNIPNVSFHAPSSAAFGDIRVGARAALLGPSITPQSPVAVALDAYVHAPSGAASSYVGEGSVRGALQAVIGGRSQGVLPIVWSVNLGTMLRFSENPHTITFGGAAALTFKEGMIRVGPEIFAAVPLGGALLSVSGADLQTGSSLNAEALLGGRVRLLDRIELGVGGGLGLTDAIGTPVARFMALAAYSPSGAKQEVTIAKDTDTDRDGIIDSLDACPQKPGEASGDKLSNGCPPDRDSDGILNVADACPTEAGPKSLDLTKNGCPPDKDGDNISDAKDACPDVRGPASSLADRNGCPLDRDGDGILDRVDACPEQKGERSSDFARNGCPDDVDGDGIKPPADACPYERGAADPSPQNNGCPKYVRVQENEIVLLKPIRFARYGKEKKDTQSFAEIEDVLREVKEVLDQHPEIELIEVQGHADGGGTSESKFNADLSKERANRVLWWLIQVGVPKEKLVDRGYGDTAPVGDNNTEEGQAMNRRAQLIILKKKK